MRGVIDRIEEGIAVIELEDRSQIFFPAKNLPKGAGEGSVLMIDITYDAQATRRQREKIKRLQEKLLKRSRGR
ncbi:DUF3006 domain-containing protein [bacterium]|nr:DUF3006 domain-containing protein [bacterium]MCG2676143.1 DUF3006 domain-containing protein [bacterium]